MTLKTWLLGAAAAVAFGAAGTTAQAAPLGNMQANAVEQNSPGLNVAWVRQCHFHRGHRHCRRVWRDGYGYGPSVGFSFGGGHRHHGHHRHNRHHGYGH
jgi:hypothetical protein